MKSLILFISFITLTLSFQNCSKSEFEKMQSPDGIPFQGVCSGSECPSGENELAVIAHKSEDNLISEHNFDYYTDELHITILNAEDDLVGCLDIADQGFSLGCSSDPADWIGFKWDHFDREGTTLRLVSHNASSFAGGNFSLYGSMLLEPNRTYRIYLFNPQRSELASTYIRVNRVLSN